MEGRGEEGGGGRARAGVSAMGEVRLVRLAALATQYVACSTPPRVVAGWVWGWGEGRKRCPPCLPHRHSIPSGLSPHALRCPSTGHTPPLATPPAASTPRPKTHRNSPGQEQQHPHTHLGHGHERPPAAVIGREGTRSRHGVRLCNPAGAQQLLADGREGNVLDAMHEDGVVTKPCRVVDLPRPGRKRKGGPSTRTQHTPSARNHDCIRNKASSVPLHHRCTP